MAAKTWQSVIDDARAILQDTDSDGYRYTDAVMLASLNRGIQELARLRPDAFSDFFHDGDIVVPQIVATDADPDDDPEEFDPEEDGEIGLTAAFNLNMMFHSPLVYFCVGAAELTDDEFTNDGRAATVMTMFKQQVISL